MRIQGKRVFTKRKQFARCRVGGIALPRWVSPTLPLHPPGSFQLAKPMVWKLTEFKLGNKCPPLFTSVFCTSPILGIIRLSCQLYKFKRQVGLFNFLSVKFTIYRQQFLGQFPHPFFGQSATVCHSRQWYADVYLILLCLGPRTSSWKQSDLQSLSTLIRPSKRIYST